MREITAYESLQNPHLVFVAFDLETTGLSPQLDRFVEIGAVKFQDGRQTARFSSLVDPEMTMPPGALAVHGISDEMLAGKPKTADILPSFLNFIAGAILVAHNATFDVGFVRSAMSRLGMGQINNDVVDTKPMAQKALPGRKSYSLQNLAADLGIKSLEAHRAEDDARVCMEVFLACLRKLNPGGQASFF